MKTFEVTLKLSVEADNHADVVAVMQDAINAKNRQLVNDGLSMRVTLESVADVEELQRKRHRR